MTAREVQRRLRSLANQEKARILRSFFKTGPGEYGEGDRFLGIMVPAQRKVVKECHTLSLGETKRLLHSAFHEERLVALLILVRKFERGTDAERATIYKLYLKNARWINNWDLVDLSAPNIVGAFLMDRKRDVLYRLARSRSLWERRIAILATFHFLRNADFADTLRISRILLDDEHDLIHKAVGWMLREVGKRDRAVEEKFLRTCYRQMPRTMLRYAIERFPEAQRRKYLKGLA